MTNVRQNWYPAILMALAAAAPSFAENAAPYHPYVASSTTLGDSPARAISRRSSCGLLVILAVPSRRPSPVIRTSTDRRRCRSMPTTCRPSCAVSIGGLPCLVETDALQHFQHPPGAGGSAPSSHQQPVSGSYSSLKELQPACLSRKQAPGGVRSPVSLSVKTVPDMLTYRLYRILSED